MTKSSRKDMKASLTNAVFRFIRFWTKLFYPKTRVRGEENLPDGPVVVVGNHAKMNAPIACELYFPGEHRTWTAGEMMHLKEVPAYSYKDFWSGKPWYSKWFFKGLSYFIAPFSVCVFNNADCIGVYHDSRIMSTFRQSIKAMHDGTRVIILPEHAVPHNNIVCDFQENFVDLARMYYRKYKEEVSFVPMYTAPALKTIYLGKSVKFDASAPIEEERRRICDSLMDGITEMARALPDHKVVPYPNIPKREYPSNKDINKEFGINGSSDATA